MRINDVVLVSEARKRAEEVVSKSSAPYALSNLRFWKEREARILDEEQARALESLEDAWLASQK